MVRAASFRPTMRSKTAGGASRRLVRTFEYELRFLTGLPNRKRGAERWKTTPGWAPRKCHALTMRSNAEPVEKQVVLDLHTRG
jgi:hypothetical protein